MGFHPAEDSRGLSDRGGLDSTRRCDDRNCSVQRQIRLVLQDGDLAVTYAVNRISGTLATGATAGMWVRWTAAWQRVDGEWLIVHDQVSVPMHFPDGRAATDLTP
jgi:ketosteroid isomerase-like protein